jgi:GT2 family glycosyltransferase
MFDWDIVTVSFNSAKQMERNWMWYQKSSKEINWVVVDNNSTDNSVETAEKLGARVIQLKKNLGFARANNVGFDKGVADYVLFANPDLRVNPSDLENLKENLLKFSGLCSPQLLNSDGSYQQNGRGLPYLSAKFGHRNFPFFKNTQRTKQYLPKVKENQVFPVEWLMGAAVCTSRENFKVIGKWNEDYFVYYEDIELGIRAKHLGFNSIIDSRILWTHEWARESNSLNFKAWRNEITSAIKFYRTFPGYFK